MKRNLFELKKLYGLYFLNQRNNLLKRLSLIEINILRNQRIHWKSLKKKQFGINSNC